MEMFIGLGVGKDGWMFREGETAEAPRFMGMTMEQGKREILSQSSTYGSFCVLLLSGPILLHARAGLVLMGIESQSGPWIVSWPCHHLWIILLFWRPRQCPATSAKALY